MNEICRYVTLGDLRVIFLYLQFRMSAVIENYIVIVRIIRIQMGILCVRSILRGASVLNLLPL